MAAVVAPRAELLRERARLQRELAAVDEQLAGLEDDSPAGMFSTYHLPPDAKSADAFNRACRTGRVEGATKRGRAWSCSAAAWEARRAAPAPRGLARVAAFGSDDASDVLDVSVLAELGAAPARRSA